MATRENAAPAEALPFLLSIPGSTETGRRAIRREVASLDEAVRLYEGARDACGEWASTFAAGEVIAASGARWRVSYNGRVQPKAARP
ncbi:MAG: hypothetical protein ACYCV6_18750 [Steroidobacteraceae bacterium]